MRKSLIEIAVLFLKLGATAFGGPAAHIAMLHAETVQRRKWLTDEQFLDLLGATNLIPGPNSTEMAIHIGYLRAGWRGLIVAGVCFILPAASIVMGLAWVYVRYGALPQADWILYGIKPVVIAIIAHAIWALGKKAVKNVMAGLVVIGVFLLYLSGVNEIALLIGGALAVLILSNAEHTETPKTALGLPVLDWRALWALPLVAIPFNLTVLFLTFLKIGSVLYGSGYVLLAFLRADFVTRLGWLTDRQLIDAIAVGQVTPGPVFTTATFIGYLLGDIPGALLATLGIFLPAFVFVAIANPLIARIRSSAWVSSLLDGVNAASLALMAAVTWQLGRTSLIDSLALLLAVFSLTLLIRFKINATWLILLGAVLGIVKAVVID